MPQAFTDTAPLDHRPYISWPAVFAGNAVTGGLILVLLPLGAAAGLSMVSPYKGDSASAATVGFAAILWLALMYLFTVSVGGYVAGRLRPRVESASSDEVSFRDMMNGFVFWGVGMIVSALFTFFTLTSAIGTAATAVGHAAAPALTEAAKALPSSDYVADLLLRGQQQSGATAPSDGNEREEIARILTVGLSDGALDEADKQYLVTLVSRETGLSQADAQARVDAGIKRASDIAARATTTAKEAAEKARKASAQGAFWTALLSLVSGLFAMYAASWGGMHRDDNRF